MKPEKSRRKRGGKKGGREPKKEAREEIRVSRKEKKKEKKKRKNTALERNVSERYNDDLNALLSNIVLLGRIYTVHIIL